MSIEDKVVLITGARLAADGGDIAIVDLNEQKMEDVPAEVRSIGRKATTFVADVTPEEVATILAVNVEGCTGASRRPRRSSRPAHRKAARTSSSWTASHWAGLRHLRMSPRSSRTSPDPTRTT